ncbi:MAG: nucleotidyl transferase AbiEii/AbiGii toxin family protein [bacterium]
MLSEQELKNLAVKLQSGFVNVAREYAQNLFLNHFYSFKDAGSIFFKGGTALRILYKSPRFSEDLDFSTKSINKKLIEDLLQDTCEKLDQEGIKVDILESKATSGGYICILAFHVGEHKFNISIEISGRKNKISGDIILVDNPYIPSYTIMALKKSELISEKIEALVDRKKPRDYFDLYYMLRGNLLPDKKVLKQLLPMIKAAKIDFRKELKEFLPQGHQNIIRDFKKILESEVERYI